MSNTAGFAGFPPEFFGNQKLTFVPGSVSTVCGTSPADFTIMHIDDLSATAKFTFFCYNLLFFSV